MGYEPDGKEAAKLLTSAWEKLKQEVDKLEKRVSALESKSHTH